MTSSLVRRLMLVIVMGMGCETPETKGIELISNAIPSKAYVRVAMDTESTGNGLLEKFWMRHCCVDANSAVAVAANGRAQIPDSQIAFIMNRLLIEEEMMSHA